MLIEPSGKSMQLSTQGTYSFEAIQKLFLNAGKDAVTAKFFKYVYDNMFSSHESDRQSVTPVVFRDQGLMVAPLDNAIVFAAPVLTWNMPLRKLYVRVLIKDFNNNKILDTVVKESSSLKTRNPQHPHTPTSRILCDAVLYHLSAPTYFEELGLLRKEWEAVGNKMYSDEEWYQLNIDFLQSHFYFSSFARKNLEKEKRANLTKLKAQLAIIKHSGISLTGDPDEIDEEKNLFDSKTKFDRGVETLFRTASHNHMQLSQMGDGKANILIGINTLILGILISAVATKLEINNPLKNIFIFSLLMKRTVQPLKQK